MFWKILILILCFCITTKNAFAENFVFNPEQSRINYSLSCLGIPFKKKFLPINGQINLSKTSSTITDLHSLDLKARFTSKNPLFKRVINYDKYPDFQFSSNLKSPVKLHNKKQIEIEGDLSFHGITKKVKIKFKNKSEKDVITLVGFINIKMTDFGLKPPRILLLRVDNIIKTKVEIYTKT